MIRVIFAKKRRKECSGGEENDIRTAKTSRGGNGREKRTQTIRYPRRNSLPKPGTLLMKCPYEVVGPDGEKIEPVGRFVMTAETIDQYHMVTDWFVGQQ